jgi:hypothetical protein
MPGGLAFARQAAGVPSATTTGKSSTADKPPGPRSTAALATSRVARARIIVVVSQRYLLKRHHGNKISGCYAATLLPTPVRAANTVSANTAVIALP